VSESSARPEGVAVDSNALKALQFYLDNYSIVDFKSLGAENKKIILGAKPFKCRFCHGEPPQKTFKKRAHAVSELLGNRIMQSLYECDDCNERFSKFEDDLAKMTYANRALGGVIGKNGIPTLVGPVGGAGHMARMKWESTGLHISHDADDVHFVEDQTNKTLTFTFAQQPYHPLGAYKALCKSAFTLLPPDELANFEELRLWLLQPDLVTNCVYTAGLHLCCRTFVPAFQPFKQPVVCLLKREKQVDAPYMSFFVATGNSSYQIFLPCPAQDAPLAGKDITLQAFPHIYQLQPWLTPAPTFENYIDLNSPHKTTEKTGSMTWKYENKIKVG
jgi:hypothetical protein